MRNTLRLLAVVKPGRYLEPGNPTGLTGLFTHPSPRSTLLYLYNATLDKLKAFPEHSVYRQSTEALTRHRLKIIESIKPEGYDEWEKNAAEKFEKNPEAFQPGGNFPSTTAGGQAFVRLAGFDENDNEWALSKGTQSKREKDAEAAFATLQELDEKDNEGASSEGLQSKQANDAKAVLSNKDSGEDHPNNVKFEAEPALDASQISDAETQIGAGLIEEVIQVAEGELKLVEIMAKSQVWDQLEESPPEGQWSYFARDQHTPGTQEPPSK